MDLFKPINEVLSFYHTEFDPSLAPRRYHRILKSLNKTNDIGFLGAVAIYGLRRTGKTLAAINIGEIARQKGYTVLYTDLDNPMFNPEGDAMKRGTIIKEAVEIARRYRKRKLLLIVDEAFIGSVRVIHKFLEAFKGLYDERAKENKRDFGILLLGSYGIDVERLRTYILRTLSPKDFPPIIASLPRICKRPSESVRIDLFTALKERPDSIIRHYVIKELSDKGILSEGFLGNEAERIYQEYESTLGMPEVIKGVKTKEELISNFSTLLEESITRFKSIVKASKDEEKKYAKISFLEIIETLKGLMSYRSERKYSDEEAKLLEFILNLGILIPRRFVRPKEIEDIVLLVHALENASLAELLGKFPIQPTPAHLFGSEFLDRLFEKPVSVRYEAITAHCLIRNAVTKYRDVAISRLPILSTRGVDFLYIYKDDLGSFDKILIEVKSGERIRDIIKEGYYEYGSRKELDRALETAEELGKPLTIITPETNKFYIGRRHLIGLIEGKRLPIYVVPIKALVAMACYTRYLRKGKDVFKSC